MKKPGKGPFGFGIVKRVKMGGKWTSVIAPDKLISREEAHRRIEELMKKYERNGNGR